MARRGNKSRNDASAVVAMLASALRGNNPQKPAKKQNTKKTTQKTPGVSFPLALQGDLRPLLSKTDYAAIRQGILTCMDHGAGLMRFNGSRVDFSVDLTPDGKLAERIANAASSAAA